MDGQLPLDTIDVDNLIAVLKDGILQVIALLNTKYFVWQDVVFTWWQFLLVMFVFDVIVYALFRGRGNDK